MHEVNTAMGAEPGGVLLFIADDFHTTHTVLCSLRLHLRDQLGLLDESPENQWKFLWVTDFPQFEKSEKGAWVSSHHPFTMPKEEHIPLLDTDPGSVRAEAYDLVLNGNEVGGGSIRIHDRTLQEKNFNLLGFTPEEAEAQFGFLLGAFEYGAPPHGGIAFGFDRLCAVMSGQSSIRDFIAFPKNNQGRDMMIDAPSVIDGEQLDELGLDLVEKGE